MPRKLTTKAITDDAITADKIVDGAVTADIPSQGVTTDKIADLGVTHAKLHTSMDLSSKTVTLPSASVTHANLHNTMDLSGKTVTLPSLTDLTVTGTLGVGSANTPTSSSGGKLVAIETTSDEHTNLVFNTANVDRNGIIEGRRTGRSNYERFAQINISNNNDNGEIQFYTAASGSDVAERMKIDYAGHILPGTNDSQDLGRSDLVWRNIYTGDLHLNNQNKTEGNIVDGTKGNWTIQEGKEDLFIINNNTGKKYAFTLREIE